MPPLSRRAFLSRSAFGLCGLPLLQSRSDAAQEADAHRLIGFTRLRVNLPGGRHVNQYTSEACLIRADGSGFRRLLPEFGARPFSWTQFAGWSPDGKQAIVACGWEDPRNGLWEEEHQTFRMTEGWRHDVGLLDLESGRYRNLTAVERVSDYNAGLYFWPNDPNRFGFEALINGISHPHRMDRDGRNKVDLSSGAEGFTYGSNASPDGRRIAYHKDYKIHLANADGSEARVIETGNPFNFAPKWSPDGEWLLFVSGEHYACHPHIVRPDGSNLRKIADRRGHRGVVTVLDVPDYHGGSSDIPVWAPDGKHIYFTAKFGGSVELMRVSVEGKQERLTFSDRPGILHYHPQVSPDGEWVLFGSNRSGRRQIHRMRTGGGKVFQVTQVPEGWGAMWGHWRPGVTYS
ncbi:MAG: PD40 domain-containing protein [Candidatus Omnitrophica bacterium]|nr:PD40 domain-containing protein [Candidatus Omnitrophota bacterium]